MTGTEPVSETLSTSDLAKRDGPVDVLFGPTAPAGKQSTHFVPWLCADSVSEEH